MPMVLVGMPPVPDDLSFEDVFVAIIQTLEQKFWRAFASHAALFKGMLTGCLCSLFTCNGLSLPVWETPIESFVCHTLVVARFNAALYELFRAIKRWLDVIRLRTHAEPSQPVNAPFYHTHAHSRKHSYRSTSPKNSRPKLKSNNTNFSHYSAHGVAFYYW